jgi:hypothetical protein
MNSCLLLVNLFFIRKDVKKMAENNDLRTIAGKALADPEFRQKLLDDPEAAVKEAGLELSEEQMNALKEVDREMLDEALSDLDERLTMSCWGFAPERVSVWGGGGGGFTGEHEAGMKSIKP